MGVFESRAVRGRHAGGRARRSPRATARSRSSAAATRSRPSTRAAWPTRSPTSRRAAAPRSSSSRARSCPASRRWRARRDQRHGHRDVRSSAATGSCTARSPSRWRSPPRCATASPPCATSTSPSRPASRRCTRWPSGSRTVRWPSPPRTASGRTRARSPARSSAPQLADAGCKLRHPRPLGAAPALRRARRGREPQGARGAARRPVAHHLRRRDAGRARRGRDARPRPGASSTPRWPSSPTPSARAHRHRLRAGLGDRHRPQRDARRRRRRCIASSARRLAHALGVAGGAMRILYGGSVKPDNVARADGRGGHRRRAGRRRVAVG